MKQLQYLKIMGVVLALSACTKYGDGFLSPTMQYSVTTFTVKKGQIASSNSLVSDGSSIPLKVKWTHIYNEKGNIVDTMFSHTYNVGVWTAPYIPASDSNYALIMAKRGTEQLPPLVVNETSGVIEANSGTLNLPAGTYTMDLEVSNPAGTQELKHAMTIILEDGKAVETSPETGNYSLGRLNANTAGAPANSGIFNGTNNPFVVETITRMADTPNTLLVKVLDRNGVVFSPKKGEWTKRPNSGLNPIPPYLQNLEYYSPDTYEARDEGMFIRFPLTPFPINSLGNGYNLYYILPTKFVHIDSTSTWSANTTPGVYYQGTGDSHYLGVFKDDKYDFSFRIPLRIQVPGSYEITLKMLDVTHR